MDYHWTSGFRCFYKASMDLNVFWDKYHKGVEEQLLWEACKCKISCHSALFQIHILFILFWNSYLLSVVTLRSWRQHVFVHYYFTLCHCTVLFMQPALFSSSILHWTNYGVTALLASPLVLYTGPLHAASRLTITLVLASSCLTTTVLCTLQLWEFGVITQMGRSRLL
jgi:hypothetical protein